MKKIATKIILITIAILINNVLSRAQLWIARDTISFFSANPDSAILMSHTDSLEMIFGKEKKSILQFDTIKINTIGFCNTFRPRSFSITHTPTNFPQKWLNDYHKAIFTLGDALKLPSTTNQPIEDIIYNYKIKYPATVQYTWRQIPETWNVIHEGRNRTKTQHEEMREMADMISTQNPKEQKTELKLPKEDVSPWTTKGQENLQISQLFLGNWAKGGESSMSLVSDFRYSAKYANGKHTWENNIISKVGITHTSTLGTRVSDDELSLTSKYGYKAVNKWYYSFQNSFKTQMFRNYASNDKDKVKPKSTLLSPAYIQFIFGMDYKTNNFSLLLSPYTAIITVVVDTATIDQTKYSIPDNRKSNTVDGFSITLNWKKQFRTEITYTTKGELFYEYFEKHGQKRFDWENVLDLQINRFLTTRVIAELRYYDNESSKFQFKENISIAFKYTF